MGEETTKRSRGMNNSKVIIEVTLGGGGGGWGLVFGGGVRALGVAGGSLCLHGAGAYMCSRSCTVFLVFFHMRDIVSKKKKFTN